MKRPALLVLFIAATACSTKAAFEKPAPPLVGFQIEMLPVTIKPGEDLEYCTYFNLDMPAKLKAEGKPLYVENIIANGIDPEATEIAVDKIEVVGAPGLHHIQVLKLENDVDDGDKQILDCAIDLFGGPLTGSVQPIFFTQKTNYSVGYEAGVGRILGRVPDKDDATQTRGAQMLYNFHYVNATKSPIVAKIVVNLHTVDRSSVVHPVRSAWWNFIYFNAKSGMVTDIDAHGSFLLDVNLLGATSHQHQTGTLFRYTRQDGTQFYENKNWAEPFYQPFPPNTTVAKGEFINFRCEWNNNTSHNLFFGLRGIDEMCTAILEYYPVDEAEGESILAMQRAQNMGRNNMNLFRTPVTLEDFVGIPDDVLRQVEMSPDHAFDVLDHDIVCGIAVNLKELELQYGKSPNILMSLQGLIDYLSPICRLPG